MAHPSAPALSSKKASPLGDPFSFSFEEIPLPMAVLSLKGNTPGEFFLNPVLQKDYFFLDNGDSSLSFLLFLESFIPEDRRRLSQDLQSFFLDKEDFEGEYRLKKKDGKSFGWVEVMANYDPAKEAAYFIFQDINEKKIDDLAFEESWSRYHSAVQATNLILFEYRLNEKLMVASHDDATQTTCAEFGIPTLISNFPESLKKIIVSDDYEVLLKTIEEAEHGQEASCEVGYFRKGGTESHCEKVTFFPANNREGKPTFLYGVGQDVSARRRLEESYQREMDFLRHNRDDSLVSKGHFDLSKNKVLEFSGTYHSASSIHPEMSYDDAVKAFAEAGYSEADQAMVFANFDREKLIANYKEGTKEVYIQYRRKVPEKQPIWLSFTLHLFVAPGSGDLECFSYVYDVTERKKIDEIMELIANAHFDYIGIIYSQEGLFEFLKKSPAISFPETRTLTNYEACRSYVRKYFVNEEESEQFAAATSLPLILKNLNEKDKFASTYHRNENGTIFAKQLDYAWLDKALGTILVVRSDITESYRRDQRQMEAINSAKLEAEKASEAKSVFLSSMSHDIRTPLNGVIGFTDIALKESDPASVHSYLLKIRSSGQLLLDLVNDILELSRIESGKSVLNPTPENVKGMLEEVVTALQPSAALKKLTLEVSFTNPENDWVMVDRLKAQKIALNLISNAIKYTPEGGKIKVQSLLLNPPQGAYNHALVVEDNGIGMSKEFIQKIYEPFSQERRQESRGVSGTGLGMSIVKGIVDLMGGEISCESAIDKGSKFTVLVPLTPVAEAPKVREMNHFEESLLKGKRVLLFEDNSINAEIATILLKDKGMLVDWVINGKVGLEKFAASEPNSYQVILMDVQMPVMGGIEATKCLRSLKRPDAKKIPIIAMTGNAFSEDVEHCLEAGMNAHLAKPIEPKKMFETILTFLK